MFTESILLELVNGGLGWLSLCLTIIFVRYMYIHFGMGYKFLQGAIALTAIWIGTVIIRTPTWYTRYQVNEGDILPIPNNWILIGSCICILGSLCAIRVFSDNAWKKWAWIVSALGGVVFLVLSYYKLLPI